MANYCTAEDIQIILGFKTAYDTNSRPTLIQINSIITDITNEIDLQLSVIDINSQPTDSRILSKLKNGCIWGSAARAGYGSLNLGASTSETKPRTYYDLYKTFLDDIIAKPEIYASTAGTDSMYASNPVIDGSFSEKEVNKILQPERYKY
jgi:hypothetical protein